LALLLLDSFNRPLSKLHSNGLQSGVSTKAKILAIERSQPRSFRAVEIPDCKSFEYRSKAHLLKPQRFFLLKNGNARFDMLKP